MTATTAAAAALRPTRIRYAVLSFIVAAYMITYLDRVLLSAAMPTVAKDFGFSLVTTGLVLSAYNWAYALFQIPGGWLGDRFGPRLALAAIVIWWSAFTALTALTWSARSMAVCLFLFGMGEAGAFPIANRALSRWILPSERGFAQGSTHAGSRLGGALTPVIVVALIARFGWRTPFFSFAVLGLVWALAWHRFYRNTPAEHSLVNAGERERIAAALGHTPSGRRRVPWGAILGKPQIWLLSTVYFLYGYDIGVFLAWFPKYLSAERHFSLQQMGLFASLPLLAGFAGDICGGSLSDALLRWTRNVKLARRSVSIFGFLLASAMILLAALAHDRMASVAFFAAAVFGLELTVGISWAVTLDIGGEFAGSVSAVMNTFGNLGAAVAAALTGYIVTTWGWTTSFAIMSAIALAAAVLNTRVDSSRRLYEAAVSL